MTNIIIGGALGLIGIIGLFVFWIIAIVKAFKAQDTLWAVLTILFPIVGLIYFFVKGDTKLGVLDLVCWLLLMVGCGFAAFSASQNPEFQKQFQEQLQQQQEQAQGH